jgi:hypothetical protein
MSPAKRGLKEENMKTIEVREWSDLTKKEQEKALGVEVEMLVEAGLEGLSLALEDGDITEDEYYKELGCSKYYAESTPWFVPACYYDKNKEEIDAEALAGVKACIYDRGGNDIVI